MQIDIYIFYLNNDIGLVDKVWPFIFGMCLNNE